MTFARRAMGHSGFRLVRIALGLSAFVCAPATWAGAAALTPPDPTLTPTPTLTLTLTATPSITPTYLARQCIVGSASSVTLSSRLVVIDLPLRGYQTWQFGRLNPDGSTRDIVISPRDSHFNCSSTVFSGVGVRLCARLDPNAASFGKVDCAGNTVSRGYNSLVQIDHNTNQNNIGLPQDPNCTNTFTAWDGTVLHSCLEGTGSACSGAANTHTGVCNSPLEQTGSGAHPMNGFQLHEPIDLSFGFGDCNALTCHCGVGTCSGGPTPGAHCGADSDCDGGTCSTVNGSPCTSSASCTGSVSPGVCAACPPDNCPRQAGEIQLAADMTSGQSKGVLWNVNNGDLIMGTIGAGDGAGICGQAAGGPSCQTTADGAVIAGRTCLGATPADVSGAAAVLTYPAIDFDPTIGDTVVTLRLQCGEPTNTPTLTPTPTETPTPTWTPAIACAVTPRTGCQQPQRAAGISLNAGALRVAWKWLGGSTPVPLSQFGDPVNGSTAYHLCVYDTSAGQPSLAFGATVPASGSCGMQPCWKQIRSRFSYTNAAATPDGVRQMTLQATGSTGASILVRGRGSNLHMPVSADGISLLRESPKVTVQLQRSDSLSCWEAEFTSPPLRSKRWAFADVIH